MHCISKNILYVAFIMMSFAHVSSCCHAASLITCISICCGGCIGGSTGGGGAVCWTGREIGAGLSGVDGMMEVVMAMVMVVVETQTYILEAEQEDSLMKVLLVTVVEQPIVVED